MKGILIQKTSIALCIGLLLAAFSRSVWADVNHSPLDGLLADHVEGEIVHYNELCQDDRLGDYLDILATSDPQRIDSEKERFALWLNAYTAYSLKAICDEYPIESINDLNFGGLILSVMLGKTVWDKEFVVIGGQTYTLKQVDHEILRKRFNDSRIQFAIACGAIGCAPVRNEAYQAERLDQQLEDQAKRFINDPKNNSFNKSKKKADLSMLFKWSMKDFGSNEEELLRYIAQYLPEDTAQSIQADPSDWKVSYKKYDLRLNDASK